MNESYGNVIEVKAFYHAPSDLTQIVVRKKSQDGKVWFAKPVEFEPLEPNTYQQPHFLIGTHELQILMDSIWECGIRPSQGSGSAGSLAATERHLADMQKLVWALLSNQGVQHE